MRLIGSFVSNDRRHVTVIAEPGDHGDGWAVWARFRSGDLEIERLHVAPWPPADWPSGDDPLEDRYARSWVTPELEEGTWQPEGDVGRGVTAALFRDTSLIQLRAWAGEQRDETESWLKQIGQLADGERLPLTYSRLSIEEQRALLAWFYDYFSEHKLHPNVAIARLWKKLGFESWDNKNVAWAVHDARRRGLLSNPKSQSGKNPKGHGSPKGTITPKAREILSELGRKVGALPAPEEDGATAGKESR